MASSYTSNYGLNQWAAEDQVLRLEFNADNEKIDAALAACARTAAAKASQEEVASLKTTLAQKAEQSALTALDARLQSELSALSGRVTSGDLWERIGHWTSAAAGTVFSIPLSGADLFDYWQLRVLFRCGPCGPISVLVNQDAGEYAYMNTYYADSSVHSACPYIAYFANYLSNHAVAGTLESQILIPGYPPAFFYTHAALMGEQISDAYGNHQTLAWEDMTSLDFTCETAIPAGAEVLILGLKR